MTEEMEQYYEERAPVYERVYDYPERQKDLSRLRSELPGLFADRRVVEVAAGTGFWTQVIAAQARFVLATDVNKAPLDEMPSLPGVETRVHDAYGLSSLPERFDAAFAALWFSHIPIERRGEWLDQLGGCLERGARVVLLDNSAEQTKRIPLVDEDSNGNTFQERQTDSGSKYRVIKNFPTEAELTKLVGQGRFVEYDCFWLFEFEMS